MILFDVKQVVCSSLWTKCHNETYELRHVIYDNITISSRTVGPTPWS